MKASFNKWRFLSILTSCILIYSTIAYTLMNPRPREQFFQLYALGSQHMIGDYYPENTTTITLNTNVSWYIGVTNFMGSIQYVMVKVKLGNASIPPPNQTTSTPSPAPEVASFRRILMDNETWEIPFNWKIKSVEEREGELYISLEINGAETGVIEVGAVNGYNFRLIFELWSYDFQAGQFVFGWSSNGERRSAWIQLWFNTTLMPG